MSSSSTSSTRRSHQNEDHEKRRNREETERKRTDGARWTTVGSSDSESDHERSRRRKRSASTSDSSCSESSDDDRRHRKEKKHRREKKHHKEKKRKHEKHEKHHRHKSSKHSRDKDRDKDRASAAVNQNEYGKYGIIREDSYFQKQKEFEVYMEEVKKIPGVGCLPRRDVVEYFKSYVEDYNTATMPHEKYYSYAKWESQKYEEEQARKANRTRNPDFVYADDEDDFPVGRSGLSDEEVRRREQQVVREKQQQLEFQQLKTRMAQSTGAREDMRRQEQLRGELQLAHRSGDTKAIARLERVLKPDDKVAALKHTEKLLGNKGGWK